ncbi:YpjP family protein [Halobacillus sp. MO56]
MKLWFRKVSVVLIAILTLGLYIPPTYADAETPAKKEIASPKEKEDAYIPAEAVIPDEEITPEPPSSDYLIDVLTERAKEQAVTKLGPKIATKVEDEFAAVILPGIEEVVTALLEEAEEQVPYYEISEQPAAGYGEKIFHLSDYRTKGEIARFDVRREKRPGEGYWFNFHYHLSKDGFEKHHDIGEIYWDKNTPPKWMA